MGLSHKFEKVRKKFSRPVRLYSIYIGFTVAYAA